MKKKKGSRSFGVAEWKKRKKLTKDFYDSLKKTDRSIQTLKLVFFEDKKALRSNIIGWARFSASQILFE